MEARRRLHAARRRPVHAAGLRVLGPVRHEPHLGRARFDPGRYLIVSDIEAARDALVAARRRGERGLPPRPETGPAERSRHPEHRSYRLASPRSAIPTATTGCCRRSRPGFPAGSTPRATSFGSANDLASAFRRAAAAHGEHEKRTGAARRELARLVRRVHGGGAGRDGRCRRERACRGEEDMTSATTPVSTQREPELAGQTVVVIGGSAASGSRRLDAPGPRVPRSSSPAAIPTGSSKRR